MKTSSPASDADGARRRDRVTLLVVVCVALGTRLPGLTEWWLNPDEGIYYSIVTRADFSGFWQEVAANAHPPLYYLLLRSLGAITWDFFWLRMFSVVCGVAAVALAWAVAREMGGRGSRGAIAGLVAGLLLAFAPGAVELSQVMRPYMLQLSLLSGAMLFLLRALRDEAGPNLPAYAVLMAAALLTHYSSALAWGAFGVLVLTVGPRRGWTDRGWRSMMAAQAVPALVVLGLYVVLIRPLAGSALADEALGGWLSFYMIHSPWDAWLSLLGFQHLLAGPWSRGPLALLFLIAIGVAIRRREHALATVTLAALGIAMMAAVLGLYPFGSTRHSIWLAAFVVPILGWLASLVARWPVERNSVMALGAIGALLLTGGPVGVLLRAPSAPWSPTDQVLRQGDLARMVGVLDPAQGPELILMSAQTFYLLMPFYPSEREAAEFSPDRSMLHFPYGARRVLTTSAWDFTAGAENSDPAHINRFLTDAARAFPALGVDRAEATLLVGGWRPAFVDELAALAEDEPFLRSSAYVPGLFAYVLAVHPLLEAFR